MKKLIFGISLFISGILGMIGIVIAATTVSYGEIDIANRMRDTGMTPYLIAFLLLAIIGLIIAYKEAYEAKSK